MGKLLLIVVSAVGLVLGVLFAFSSPRYEVVREITINAPSTEVHALVEDLERWPEWSAWNEDYDETLTYSYSGSEKGVDAHSSWTSEKSGPGSLHITSSDPAKGVWYDMTFGEGEKVMHSKGALQFEAVEGGTRVRWSNAGELSGFYRLMGFMMDSMMGPSFEDGLAGLKEAAEGAGDA